MNMEIEKARADFAFSDGVEYARKVASAHVDYSKDETKQAERFEDFFITCLLAYLRGSGTELTAVQALSLKETALSEFDNYCKRD